MKPFWSLSLTDSENLKAQFTKLTRAAHPDRFAGQGHEAVARAEALTAQLTSAYSIVKDPSMLADFVLQNAPAFETRKAQLPPALAAEYFELQEEPASAELVAAFRTKLLAWVRQSESEFVTVTSRHPYQGPGTPEAAPWTLQDLQDLKRSREIQRFARSLLNDFDQKFKDSHAHSD